MTAPNAVTSRRDHRERIVGDLHAAPDRAPAGGVADDGERVRDDAHHDEYAAHPGGADLVTAPAAPPAAQRAQPKPDARDHEAKVMSAMLVRTHASNVRSLACGRRGSTTVQVR